MATMQQRVDEARELLLTLGPQSPVMEGQQGFAELANLLARHPDYAEKRGAGVVAFEIGASFAGHIALWVRRRDGSRADVSWRKCATGKDRTREASLYAAMREAVVCQITQFRREHADAAMPCALCGLQIRDCSTAHVDHTTPFRDIAAGFLVGQGTSPASFDENPDTHQVRFRLEDHAFASAWQAFHRVNAVLRLVHAECNLRRPRSS